MKERLVVLGDGGWGTTVAILLAKKGLDVTLWGVFPEYIALLKRKRINHKFLPGIKIPERVRLSSDISELPDGAIYIIAIPCEYMRKTLVNFKNKIGGKLVSLTKGIEIESLKRPCEILSDIFKASKIAALSGPSISYEVARDMPTTVVAASCDAAFVKEVQEIFSTPSFRVYTSDDLKGVELGGALKNIIAIAAGISDGMGFGVNTKSAILTRGLVEIIRLGVKMGARKETFFGLSGLGDLATTCMSRHSRNRMLGEKIGKGEKLEDVLKETEMVVEGVATTKSAYELSRRNGSEMPIIKKIYGVLYENEDPRSAVRELMTRSLKAEAI